MAFTSFLRALLGIYLLFLSGEGSERFPRSSLRGSDSREALFGCFILGYSLIVIEGFRFILSDIITCSTLIGIMSISGSILIYLLINFYLIRPFGFNGCLNYSSNLICSLYSSITKAFFTFAIFFITGAITISSP